MAVTEKGKRYRRTMLVKFGGCEVYDGCMECERAIERYRDYHRSRAKKGGQVGGKAKVPKGRNKKVGTQ